MTAQTSQDVPLPRARVEGGPPQRVLLAIGFVLLSAFLFSTCDVAAKMLRETAPAPLVTWMRYIVYLAVALPYVLVRRGPGVLVTRKPLLQAGRGLAAVMSTTMFISGLAYQDVSFNTAIHFMSPIYMTLMAVLVLRETVGLRQWIATFVGFCGVLLVVQPGGASLSPMLLFPIASGFFWASGALLTRLMRSESSETIFVWTGIIGSLLTSIIVIPVFRLPVGAEWTYALIGSVAFAFAHLTGITALRLAPLSLVAPITYVQLVFTGLMSVVIVGQTPDVLTIAGSVLIAVGGLEAARRRQPQGEETAPTV